MKHDQVEVEVENYSALALTLALTSYFSIIPFFLILICQFTLSGSRSMLWNMMSQDIIKSESWLI